MGMINNALIDCEENLTESFNCIDKALHAIKKIKEYGLYKSETLDKAYALIGNVHAILDDEEQLFQDKVFPETF